MEKEILVRIDDPKLVKELANELRSGRFGVVMESRDAADSARGDLSAVGVKTVAPTPWADVELVPEGRTRGDTDKPIAIKTAIMEKGDVDRVVGLAEKGVDGVIVETGDWRVIPLENVIASIQGTNLKLYAALDDPKEARLASEILEKGVDGIVVEVSAAEELRQVVEALGETLPLDLVETRVKLVEQLGSGERVCVDTASIIEKGEGLLAGSKAGFLFLVHSENIESPFISPRPFRVNAGPVHSYILVLGGKTKYLSELEAGSEILLVNSQGLTRRAAVGRVKIETRPLTLVVAEFQGRTGKILLQTAETVSLTRAKGDPIPVTSLEVGDQVLAHVSGASGRHFGTAVDEFVLER